MTLRAPRVKPTPAWAQQDKPSADPGSDEVYEGAQIIPEWCPPLGGAASEGENSEPNVSASPSNSGLTTLTFLRTMLS